MSRYYFALFLLFALLSTANLPGQDADKAPEATETTETAEEGENANTEREPNPYFTFLVEPDSNLKWRYDQALRLLNAGRFPEAAQLLGSLLESQVDFFLAPDWDADHPSAADRTSRQTYEDLILRRLREMPAKGRESYALQYETLAKRLLDEAVATGSLEGLQYVAKRYLPTRAGQTALLLIAVDQFENGLSGAALLNLLRLEDDPRGDLARLEPLYSLTLTGCYLRLGERDEARSALERFLRRVPNPEIVLVGRQRWTPRDADEMLERLETLARQPEPGLFAASFEHRGWLLTPGTPDQNPETLADKPIMEINWAIPAANGQETQDNLQKIYGYLQSLRDAQIPAGSPLLAGGKLLIRNLDEIMAVAPETGKRLWLSEQLRYNVHDSLLSRIPRQSAQQGLSLFRFFFWHDRVLHQLSSDGPRVYSVEGMPSLPDAYAGMERGRRDWNINGKTYEDPFNDGGNTLVARDVQTGRILWKAGKFEFVQRFLDQRRSDIENAKSKTDKDGADNAAVEPFTAEEIFLGKTWFLGAPLPHRDRLYAIGENEDTIRLLIFEAETGRFLQQVPLSQVQDPLAMTPRRYYGLMPSEAEGILLCPTGQGQLVAVDSSTGRPLWNFSYLSAGGPISRANRNPRHISFNTLPLDSPLVRNFFAQSGWQAPSIMIDGRRVLVAPHDQAALHCVDLFTGEALWSEIRYIGQMPPLYVACVRNDIAYIVTANSINAVSMKDGEAVRDFVKPAAGNENEATHPAGSTAGTRGNTQPYRLEFPEGLKPSGRGIHNGPLYYLPFSRGCMGRIDLDAGTLEILSPGHRTSKTTDDTGESRSPTFDGVPETPLEFFQASNFPLGNLVALQGRYYSQSPVQISCFDQLEPLQKRVDALLTADAGDPRALLLAARLRGVEGDLRKAVELLRKSLQSQPSETAATRLRQILLEAVGNDYEAWAPLAGELEQLADFPEQLGEILLVLAEGARKSDRFDEYAAYVKKAFYLESDREITVPVEVGYRARLHRVLGVLGEENAKTSRAFRERRDRLAGELFDAIESGRAGAEARAFLSEYAGRAKPFAVRPYWEPETAPNRYRIRQWRIFLDLFRGAARSADAEKRLLEQFLRQREDSALEILAGPPVQWFLPPALEARVLGTDDDAPDASASSGSASPSAPPYLPPPLPDREISRLLAERLLAAGNALDAFYYLRILDESCGDEGKADAKAIRDNGENEALRRYIEREEADRHWPDGPATLSEKELSPLDSIASRIYREAHSGGRPIANRFSLPLLGGGAPFHDGNNHVLENVSPNNPDGAGTLACYDDFGNILWRLSLDSYNLEIDMQGSAFRVNQFDTRDVTLRETGKFLCGSDHRLLLVNSTSEASDLLLLDTFRLDGGSPTVLWHRKIPTKFAYREDRGALMVRDYEIMFPTRSVFLSPEVVCYHDAKKLYGLDPETGKTLWSRDLADSVASLHGDREFLFVVYPRQESAVGIDARSGRELVSGTIPGGVVQAFDTNLVILDLMSTVSQGTTKKYQILVCDLRELYQKRLRALWVTNNSQWRSAGKKTPSIPLYLIRQGISTGSALQTFENGRFLASLSWDTHSLQIYDLLTKRDVLGVRGEWGRRSGVKLPERKNPHFDARQPCDLDVERLGDKFLVYFAESTQIETGDRKIPNEQDETGSGDPNTEGYRSPPDDEAKGWRTRRRAIPLNLPCRGASGAFLMLYDMDGNTCWDAPVPVRDWCRLLEVPPRLPVKLFAVNIVDKVGGEKAEDFNTGLLGIDKRTGRRRFREMVPVNPRENQPQLEDFQIAIDPKAARLDILGRERFIKVTFEKSERVNE